MTKNYPAIIWLSQISRSSQMAYKTALIRTDDSLDALEQALVLSHGDMTEACRIAGFPGLMAAVHFWMADDPQAEQRLRAAQLIGYSRLENVLYERAVVGVEEPVFYQGVIAGYKTVYSDGLLAQMAKARIPAYKADASTSGPSLQVNIMPRAETYEAWVQMRQHALSEAAHEQKRLMDTRAEDADYEPVTESSLRDVL